MATRVEFDQVHLTSISTLRRGPIMGYQFISTRRGGPIGNGGLVYSLVGVVLAQLEHYYVRGTWRRVPAHIESWPYEQQSANGQCGWIRISGVLESHPEMSEWGSVRGTLRWTLTHVESRPWRHPSIGLRRGISESSELIWTAWETPSQVLLLLWVPLVLVWAPDL